MSKRTILAFVMFAGLLAAVLYVRGIPQKGDRTSDRPGPFEEIAAEEIAEITIKSPEGSVTLERVDADNFRVAAPIDYPADSYATKSLVDKLSKFVFSGVVTDKPDKHAEFEVDQAKGVRVTVKDKAGKARADFFVGKFMSGATMIRAADKNEVFQAVGSLKHVFAKDLRGWRDKTVLKFEREEARHLRIKTASGTIALERGDDATWKVESSPLPIPDLDQAMPPRVVTTMATLRADDFVDDATAATGFEAPEAEITVTLKDGTKHALLIGGQKNERQSYARPPDGKQVFLLQKHTVDRLAHPPIAFRDKTVLSFKADDAREIKITKGKNSVTLVKNDTSWTARPTIVDLDANKVREIVSTLSDLRATTLSEEAIVGKPTGKVAVRLKDNTRVRLDIGPLLNEKDHYVQREGHDDTFLIGKFVVDRFLVDAEGLKSSNNPPRPGPPGMPPGMPMLPPR